MRASAAQVNRPCRHSRASKVAVGSAAAALTVAIGSVVLRSRPGNEQRQREAQILVERRLENRVNGVALVLVISHPGQRASRNTLHPQTIDNSIAHSNSTRRHVRGRGRPSGRVVSERDASQYCKDGSRHAAQNGQFVTKECVQARSQIANPT
jgi:hypothetical protein